MADKNIEVSMKDFDTNRMHIVNRARKRQHTMTQNLKASQLIIAAKKIKKERQEADLREATLAFREIINDEDKLADATIKAFDNRIKALQKKVDTLTELQAAQDGFLKQGQEKALSDYKIEIERLEGDKVKHIEKMKLRAINNEKLEKERAKQIKAEAKLEADSTKPVKAKEDHKEDSKPKTKPKAKAKGAK